MKKRYGKWLAAIVTVAMTATSLNATALVSAADLSAEVTEEVTEQADENVSTDEEAEITDENNVDDTEEADIDVLPEETEQQDEDVVNVSENVSNEEGADLFSDEVNADTVGENDGFIPTTGVTSMNLDTEYTLNFTESDERKWFAFTPSQNGNYVFEVYDVDEDINAAGYLYRSDAIVEYDDSMASLNKGVHNVGLSVGHVYYYCADWNTYKDGVSGGSYKVKIYKAAKVKTATIEAESAKTEFYQAIDELSFKGSKVTLEYDDGAKNTYDVMESEIPDENGFLADFVDKYGVYYNIGVSGAEDDNKDIINIGSGSLKKIGKYKTQIIDSDTKVIIGTGYEINILPVPELPALQNGVNANIPEGKWYTYTPEVTGIYYIENVNRMLDQKFDICFGKSYGQGYEMKKGETYYISFYMNSGQTTKDISIGLAPKVTEFTVTPDANEGNWGEDTTRIMGYYHLKAENNAEAGGGYSFDTNNDFYDRYGHHITMEVWDSAGNVVKDNKKKLRPGKYTYRLKADELETEIFTFTVKEVPAYTKLKEGENYFADVNKNVVGEYYEFRPEATDLYKIEEYGYGYLSEIYYMDENKDYQSVNEEDQFWTYNLQKGKTYYIYIECVDLDPDLKPERTITITRFGNESCDWSAPEVKTPATCGKDGVAIETCKVHGETKTVPLPATGKHTYKWNIVQEASAVTAGSQVEKCTVCGATGKTEAIAKLPATLALNVAAKKTIPLKVKQSFNVKASGFAKGDAVKSWKSSNSKVASVSANGKITGKKAGTATITVTLNSGYTTWIKVKVQKKAVTTSSIKVLNKATGKTVAKNVTLKRKGKLNLTTTVAPVTSKQKVTYSSSNKKIATVNAKGVITAKKAGTATITVKSGKKSVKIKVKVTK